MEIRPGHPYPLGATFDGHGTNFAIHSHAAERVDLCLFDDADRETRVSLKERTAHTWHGYVPTVSPGQRYGFRVYGPFAPGDGHRCNPQKLLLDPYAQAISGQVAWNASLFDYDKKTSAFVRNPEDTAAFVPKSLVVSSHFDWADERRPMRPWNETVIYETHVKGLTKQLAAVPAALRGTYAGLGHPACIRYLLELGVTAVELLPVHHFLTEPFLANKRLTNYWGYNTIGFFAPHAEYAASCAVGGQVEEFKYMVRELHRAGIEVILDVVYNHTAEGGSDGPTLCLRGLDNLRTYRCSASDKTKYIDFTGCGNTLNMQEPSVAQLMMDSLRYWVTEMHVDGFRFDLASALARDAGDVEHTSTFFKLIQQDPVLRTVKLIAEPWDLGQGGYRVGQFPALWSEWNGRYRDSVRDFWRGRASIAELAYRFTGSSDLYESSGRKPSASVNFITAHDGFTLHDLVSFNQKHNLGNGEDNRDGESHNRSWNCGVEGPTQDPTIVALRRRQQRNLLTTLLLSQGVPMLSAGDELGRSQGGNNNAYCQDNDLSWHPWASADEELQSFTRFLINLRKNNPVFRKNQFFCGDMSLEKAKREIDWFRPDGHAMTEKDWGAHYARAICVYLNGVATGQAEGSPTTADSFMLLFNAGHEAIDFVLPATPHGDVFREELYTATETVKAKKDPFRVGNTVNLVAYSVRVLRKTGLTQPGLKQNPADAS